jgi:hypothetical protein
MNQTELFYILTNVLFLIAALLMFGQNLYYFIKYTTYFDDNYEFKKTEEKDQAEKQELKEKILFSVICFSIALIVIVWSILDISFACNGTIYFK